MVGGYDFERSKFNRATQAMRQVGSAFKPIVYAAAIEKLGWTPSTIIVDAPLSFPNPWNKTVWTPHNYDGAYLGPIPLRRAVEQSRNIPAVKTLQAVGVEKGIEYARKLGLTGELPPYLPIALGAGEATLVEMVGGLRHVRQPGPAHEAVPHRADHRPRRQRRRAGDAPGHGRAPGRHRLHPDVAPARRRRSGARRPGRAGSGGPIAGKTGTTNDFTDAWFIGYEPSLAAGVWVGFDEKKDSLGRGETGADAALPIWMDFWGAVTADRPVEEYPIPGNVVFVPVDEMGRPGAPGAAGVRMEAFVAGTEPRAAKEPADRAVARAGRAVGDRATGVVHGSAGGLAAPGRPARGR